jgi:phosphatidylglycerol:prolipoprotein diacylglycerol transferase
MHPILFETPYFSLKAYGLFVAIGFLAGITYCVREGVKQGYNQQHILDLGFYIILAAIVGSRIFYVITNLDSYRHNLLDIFKVWQGGLTFFGGFILALLAGIVYMKKYNLPVGKTLDLFAPSLSIGEFFGRIGCFFAGCCYGRECSMPWAVTFTDPQSLARIGVPLHPTQLYAAAAALVTFLILVFWSKRKSFDGQLALIWILIYSTFRAVVEFFRGDPRGYLIMNTFAVSQVISAALIIISLILLIYLKRKNSSR